MAVTGILFFDPTSGLKLWLCVLLQTGEAAGVMTSVLEGQETLLDPAPVVQGRKVRNSSLQAGKHVLKSLGIECDQTFPKLDKTSVWHHGTEHEQYLFLHCVDVSPQEPHSCMFWLKRQGKGTGICCGTTGPVAGNSWFFSTMVLAWYLWAKEDSQPELLQTSAQVHVAQRSQLKRTCF